MKQSYTSIILDVRLIAFFKKAFFQASEKVGEHNKS